MSYSMNNHFDSYIMEEILSRCNKGHLSTFSQKRKRQKLRKDLEGVGLLCYHPTVADRAAGKNSISLPSARLRTT